VDFENRAPKKIISIRICGLFQRKKCTKTKQNKKEIEKKRKEKQKEKDKVNKNWWTFRIAHQKICSIRICGLFEQKQNIKK